MSDSALPPSPSGSALTHTARFIRDPFTLIDEAREECGEIFQMRLLGLGRWVFLCAPDLLKDMYRASDEVLAAGEVNRDQLGHIVGSDATFSLDGKAHRDRQRLILPHLTGKPVFRHAGMIRELTEEMIDCWPLGEPFGLLHRVHRMSLEVLIRVVFGDVEEARTRELVDIFDTFVSRGLRSPLVMLPFLQIDLGRFSPWGKVMAMRKAVFDAFTIEVDQRLARDDAEESSDLLSSVVRDSREAGQPLARSSLLDEIVNLIFAGHETTGLGVTWTIERTLANPEVKARLVKELDDALGGEPIGRAGFGDLPYLAAVVHETLRYRPFAPMAGVRRVKKPWKVRDYVIPEGYVVTQAFSAMARRPETFPDPRSFDPGHFFQKQLERYSWQPFGGGRHMCLGKGLAEVELTVILATLLQRTELRIAQDDVHQVREGVFFGPNRGLRVVLERRL